MYINTQIDRRIDKSCLLMMNSNYFVLSTRSYNFCLQGLPSSDLFSVESYPVYEEITRGPSFRSKEGTRGSSKEGAPCLLDSTEFPEWGTPRENLVPPSLRPLIIRARPSQTINIKRTKSHRELTSTNNRLVKSTPSDASTKIRLVNSSNQRLKNVSNARQLNPSIQLSRQLNSSNQLTSFQQPPVVNRTDAVSALNHYQAVSVVASNKDEHKDFIESEDCTQALLR